MKNTTKFSLGFSTLNKEVALKKLRVEGGIPQWLCGTLVRNGPAQFEAGRNKLRHWFDGFAMLHAFSFEYGAVSYTNKFLATKARAYAQATGTIGYAEFATDPCRSIFKRFAQLFFPKITDNANVNVSKIADTFIALTETPLPIAFDMKTLNTLGVTPYNDDIKSSITTAHPHYDFEKHEEINYLTRFSAKSSYILYRIPRGSKTRKVIGTIPVKEPSYMHSFGVTKNYIVLAEYPFSVNPLRLLASGKPFIENFQWKPHRGTHFLLFNRNNGVLEGRYAADAFFAFHHINAFEEQDKIIIDIVAYPHADIVQSLYLDVLRGKRGTSIVPAGEFRRYTISRADGLVRADVLAVEPVELPRIHYKWAHTNDYRFVYGTGSEKTNADNFLDRLLKIDIKTQNTKIWKENGCYPGEPVFVPAPHCAKEDEGIILSVVLNAKKGNSFLLVLDALSFSEKARAEVPHHIPFGFHGQFYEEE